MIGVCIRVGRGNTSDGRRFLLSSNAWVSGRAGVSSSRSTIDRSLVATDESGGAMRWCSNVVHELLGVLVIGILTGIDGLVFKSFDHYIQISLARDGRRTDAYVCRRQPQQGSPMLVLPSRSSDSPEKRQR